MIAIDNCLGCLGCLGDVLEMITNMNGRLNLLSEKGIVIIASVKKTKGQLAKEILAAILEHNVEFAMSIAESFKYPHITRGTYYRNPEIEKAEEKRRIKQELARLKRQKFIKERKIGNQLELCLTEKGEKAALRYQILNCNATLKNKFYIVVFDIPESERNMRNFFRVFLKEAGFIYLQQSVWVTQKDIAKHLNELICAAGAEKWVHIITATEISNFSFDKERTKRDG